MSRNRLRAKQRQAERRARQGPGQPRAAEPPPITDPRVSEPAPGIDPELAVGAPPQEEGRSDLVIADEPVLDDHEHLTEEEEAEELADEEEAGFQPRGRRGAERPEKKSRSRVVQFLVASWAELQRVQWPNRQALTTLTGVVLGFVLIAGGYLGLMDAIVSRIIKAIL
ncbi:MAG: preprotein translocase subunit SecE [Gemmatimonadales bacterium]